MDCDASDSDSRSGSDQDRDGGRKRLRSDSGGEEQQEEAPRLRARRWVYTLNNPGADWTGTYRDGEAAATAGWTGCATFPSFIQYNKYQIESGEEKGTLHVQGYCECSRAVDLGRLRQWLPRAHFEVARGTQKQCIDYVSKESTRLMGPYEWGTAKKQGQRSDLDNIASQLNTGATMREIAICFPTQFIRYYRGLGAYQDILGGNARPNIRVIIYWGASGRGKTRRAKHEFPGAADIPETREGWLGNYYDERTILFDDFEGVFPQRLILKICSHHAHQFAIKGGFKWLRAETIVFTSNTDPRTWYTDRNGGESEPWIRRLEETWTTIEHMEEDWVPPIGTDE